MAASLVILAAGMGSRYQALKQADALGSAGERLPEFALFDAARCGFDHAVVVIGPDFPDEIQDDWQQKAARVSLSLDFAPQPRDRSKPWGTGHAVLAARPFVNSNFGVINGDDFYGLSSLRQLQRATQQCTANCCALVAFELGNTLSAHGPVSRGIIALDDEQQLVAITEHTHLVQDAAGIRSLQTDQLFAANTLVSMNCWAFDQSFFGVLEQGFDSFRAAHAHDEAEFYLPSAVTEAVRAGAMQVDVKTSSERWFGLTYPEDRNLAVARLKELATNGSYPQPLWPDDL